MLLFDRLLSITVVLLAANVIYSTEASQRSVFTRPNVRLVQIDNGTQTAVQPRIVGGEPAKLIDFPWMISLRYYTGDSIYGCSGSILNPTTILTAAHCVSIDPLQTNGFFEVTAGNYKLDEVDRSEQTVRVEEVIVHPGYDTNVLGNNDIAILKLVERLITSKRVKKIDLPGQTKATLLYKRNNCVVIGYGLISTPENESPAVLQKADVTIRSKRYCSRITLNIQFNKLLCTDHNGRGVCYGDSGGPLVCYDEKDRVYQVGVTSLTNRCQGQSIFVSVPKTLKWIRRNS